MDFGAMLNDMQVTYTLDQIKSCAKCFNQLAVLIQKSKLQMIVKKFKAAKYFEVARIVSQGTTKKTSTATAAQSQGRTASNSQSKKQGDAQSTQKSS